MNYKGKVWSETIKYSLVYREHLVAFQLFANFRNMFSKTQGIVQC